MAGSNFDLLESTMMDVITNQFGYSASWSPSTGGDVKFAKVLFGDPTKAAFVQAAAFDGDTNPFMEYKKGDLDGLVEAVRDTKKKETVIIDSKQYRCRMVKKKYDGDTIIITLEAI